MLRRQSANTRFPILVNTQERSAQEMIPEVWELIHDRTGLLREVKLTRRSKGSQSKRSREERSTAKQRKAQLTRER